MSESEKTAVEESAEVEVKTEAKVETEPVVITEKKVKKKQIKQQEPEAVSVMYLGPSIENVVQYSTIFKDGVLTDALKECIERAPYLKKLLVPLDLLPASMKELNTEKSALSVIYNKAKKEF